MKIILVLFAMLMTAVSAFASEPFNGLIVDLSGKPIKGAKIYTKNPKHYAKTDKAGKFGLSQIEANDTLHIKVKRMEYLIPVNGSTGMRISLGDFTAEGIADEELAKAGIGYVKKREYLGPHGVVTGEKLAATGESNLVLAMQGAIPGIIVKHTADGYDLSIRNSTSFNANTNPLWIVDGVENASIARALTVMEVEKVEVIKDGAGYGTRGANGVIIVTTKGSK